MPKQLKEQLKEHLEGEAGEKIIDGIEGVFSKKELQRGNWSGV